MAKFKNPKKVRLLDLYDDDIWSQLEINGWTDTLKVQENAINYGKYA